MYPTPHSHLKGSVCARVSDLMESLLLCCIRLHLGWVILSLYPWGPVMCDPGVLSPYQHRLDLQFVLTFGCGFLSSAEAQSRATAVFPCVLSIILVRASFSLEEFVHIESHLFRECLASACVPREGEPECGGYKRQLVHVSN